MGGLEAIVINVYGYRTTIKDYGVMLHLAYAENVTYVSALAKDITEYLATLDLPQQEAKGLTVAYHSAGCMQHGQKITMATKTLLKAAVFMVRDPARAFAAPRPAPTTSRSPKSPAS